MPNSIIVIADKVGKGELGISRNALIDIAARQIEAVEGVELFGVSKKSPIKSQNYPKASTLLTYSDALSVTLKRDGSIMVKAEISIGKAYNPAKLCDELQEKIATAIEMATGRGKVEVLLELKGIGNGKSRE